MKFAPFLFLIAAATAAHAASPPPLEPRVADEVLTLIDNACGDSWCESDFNFIFDAFGCDFDQKQCTLGFRLYPLDREDLVSSPQICQLGPVASATDLLEGLYDERLVRLQPAFYQQVDLCLSSAIDRQTSLLQGKY